MLMRRIEKAITIVLLPLLLFAQTGCGKKIQYVQADEFTEVLERYFDIEEESEYSTNAYTVSYGHTDYECIITAVVDNPSGNIKVRYQTFEDSNEAAEAFGGYYDRLIEEGSEVASVSGYHTDSSGGYIVLDDGDFLLSYYCSDNMLLKVEAHSEECVDSARQFVDELGLPE